MLPTVHIERVSKLSWLPPKDSWELQFYDRFKNAQGSFQCPPEAATSVGNYCSISGGEFFKDSLLKPRKYSKCQFPAPETTTSAGPIWRWGLGRDSHIPVQPSCSAWCKPCRHRGKDGDVGYVNLLFTLLVQGTFLGGGILLSPMASPLHGNAMPTVGWRIPI